MEIVTCYESKSVSLWSVFALHVWSHGLYSPPGSSYLWNSPGQNTGVGSHSLLQGIFLTQGLNPGLLHCRWILYQLSYKGSGRILKWVAYPSSNREVNQNFQANFCPHKLPFLKNFVFVLYNWFFFFHLNTIHFHNYNNLYFVLLYFHFWVRLKSHCFPIALAIVSNL